MMWWFVSAYLFVGASICAAMRWNWGAPIRNEKYVATVLLWPLIFTLLAFGKL